MVYKGLRELGDLSGRKNSNKTWFSREEQTHTRPGQIILNKDTRLGKQHVKPQSEWKQRANSIGIARYYSSSGRQEFPSGVSNSELPHYETMTKAFMPLFTDRIRFSLHICVNESPLHQRTRSEVGECAHMAVLPTPLSFLIEQTDRNLSLANSFPDLEEPFNGRMYHVPDSVIKHFTYLSH